MNTEEIRELLARIFDELNRLRNDLWVRDDRLIILLPTYVYELLELYATKSNVYFATRTIATLFGVECKKNDYISAPVVGVKIKHD